MIRRSKVILFSTALLACVGIAGPRPCRADTPHVAAAAGDYDVKVAGWVTGGGHSTASGKNVSITATVADENGNQGDLSASNLTMDDKLYFRGTGTVLGKSMTVSGRIDAPGGNEKQLKTYRIVGTFVTDDGHYGRIAGFIPGVKVHGKPDNPDTGGGTDDSGTGHNGGPTNGGDKDGNKSGPRGGGNDNGQGNNGQDQGDRKGNDGNGKGNHGNGLGNGGGDGSNGHGKAGGLRRQGR